MSTTYGAIEVKKPGEFSEVRKPLLDPGPNQVRICVDVGVGPDPIKVTSMDLIFGSRKLEAALTWDPATGDATLRFSALSGVSAMIETAPLKQAPAA